MFDVIIEVEEDGEIKDVTMFSGVDENEANRQCTNLSNEGLEAFITDHKPE